MYNVTLMLDESKCCETLMFGVWTCEDYAEGEPLETEPLCMQSMNPKTRGKELDCGKYGRVIEQIPGVGTKKWKAAPVAIVRMFYNYTTL